MMQKQKREKIKKTKVIRLEGIPNFVDFNGWCRRSFDVVFLDTSVEINFKTISSTDQAMDFLYRVCDRNKYRYRFSICTIGSRSRSVLRARHNNKEWDLGVVPKNIDSLITGIQLSGLFGTSIVVDKFSCCKRMIGEDMGMSKWNDLMRVSDLLDYIDVSDDEFKGIMESVSGTVERFSCVTKLRIVFINSDNEFQDEV